MNIEKERNDMLGSHKRWRRGGRASAVAVLAALLALAAASSASATPKGEYAVFADCPLATPHLNACLVAKTESGEITLGKKTVPIKNVITLQGGIAENVKTEQEEFVGAADGNTLSKTPQTVPGGLLGVVAPSFLPKFLQELFNEFINKGATGVTATTELVGPVTLSEHNLLFEEGVALNLPVRVHLENGFLGSACYIGSSSSPVNLKLTTGTTAPPLPNKPIKGKLGTESSNEAGTILTISNNTLVDNAFSAPGVNGCGGIFSFLIDPAVEAQLGLPSKAGTNTAILNGTLKQAEAEEVKRHE